MTIDPVKTQQIIERDLEWTHAHRDLDLELIEDILSEQYQQMVHILGKAICWHLIDPGIASGRLLKAATIRSSFQVIWPF